MKRIILVSAFAVLAACGSTKSDVSGGTATDQTSAGSEDTTNVDSLADMPPKCFELFTSFLKKIEPEASKIDWEKATLADFEAFGEQFQADSDAFDAQSTAAGCDKYNLDASDKKIFEQIVKVAAAEAPGTLGFLQFLGALSTDSTASSGSIPADCAGTIAAIEPFLADGKSMKDLTIVEVSRLGNLMTGVSTNCTADEAAAFYARADVTTFIGG